MTGTPPAPSHVAPSRTSARRRRWVAVQAWVALLAPVALYVFANLRTSHGDPTMIVAGIACPLIFWLAVHLETEQPARWWSRGMRATQRTLTVTILACTGAWSWVHLIELVTLSGVPLWQAMLLPLVIDSLLVVALIVLHGLRRDSWGEAEAEEEGLRLTMPAETVEAIATEYEITVQQETDPTVLYQLLSGDEELLYVGATSNLDRRLADHRRSKPWFGEVADMIVRTYPTRGAAIAVEHHMITTLWPLHNKMPGSHADALTKGYYAPTSKPERRTVNEKPHLRAVPDDGLEELSRDRLREVARAEGVPVRGSRAELAERVRSARATRDDSDGSVSA